MKKYDKCTYVTRTGNELPARVTAVVDELAEVEIEAQRTTDSEWMRLGPRAIVTDDDVKTAHERSDPLPDSKAKYDALGVVRGAVYEKKPKADKATK